MHDRPLYNTSVHTHTHTKR